MLLPKNRSFIECDVDPTCVTRAIPQLIVLYGRQLLSKEWAIAGKNKFVLLRGYKS